MTLIHIIILSLAAALISISRNTRWRGWIMLAASVLAVYWLQPATPLRYFNFWLPTATLALTVIIWVVTRAGEPGRVKDNILTAGVIAALVLIVGLTRFLSIDWQLIRTYPPSMLCILLVMALLGVVIALLSWIRQSSLWSFWPLSLLIVGLFVITKADPLAIWASRVIRIWIGQSVEMTSSVDLNWLGFSYLSLRFLHTLRDRISGRLPELSLREFINYVIFFPTLTAGPIDRAERFVLDLRTSTRLTAVQTIEGTKRIIIGLFKKFVLADSLAVIALNAANAEQVGAPLWLWVLLYAYAFQIYLDFSGYTDVAVGIGCLAGITLPENFDRPYLKQNITAFWNSWHMTLAKWFRAYYFNPLSRVLLRGRRRLLPWMMIFMAQISTMALIGLWHGVTWNFLIWGVWHGVGLFMHNRWIAFLKARPQSVPQVLLTSRAMRVASTILTFHFVVIGWVWFAMPEIRLSVNVLARLFGL